MKPKAKTKTAPALPRAYHIEWCKINGKRVYLVCIPCRPEAFARRLVAAHNNPPDIESLVDLHIETSGKSVGFSRAEIRQCKALYHGRVKAGLTAVLAAVGVAAHNRRART